MNDYFLAQTQMHMTKIEGKITIKIMKKNITAMLY